MQKYLNLCIQKSKQVSKKSEYFVNGPDGCKFYFREFCAVNTAKANILVTHGLSDHGGRFLFIAEKLTEAGYNVFIPDLRGNGLSDGIRGHFDSARQMLDDITFFISDIKKKNELPVILYGQSMGGNIVLAYALNFAENIKAAIASSPWLRLANPPAKMLVKISPFLAKMLPKIKIPNGLKSSDLTHDKQIASVYDHDPLIHWKITFSTFYHITKQGEDSIHYAANLKIPVLLMHGDSDNITSFAASEEFRANSGKLLTFVPWKGMFHELHNEAVKEEVLKTAVDWLNDLK